MSADPPSASGDPGPPSRDPQSTPNKPWPLSWILIIVLGYILLQTIYFLFFTD